MINMVLGVACAFLMFAAAPFLGRGLAAWFDAVNEWLDQRQSSKDSSK